MKTGRIQSFPPLLSATPKVLILGTMPSVKSLEQEEYYGNRQNVFWKLLFAVFEEPLSTVYQSKVNLIQNHHLALWDVLQSCEREGSLDSAIKAEHPNNICQLLRDYPSIQLIVFSSQNAAKYFKKYIGIKVGIPMVTLPSPSGANARMTFDEKLKAWSSLKEWCE